MKLHDVPPAEWVPRYREPPPSGNEINGLGVSEPMRARRVFHAVERADFPWRALNFFFLLNNTIGIMKEALRYRWRLRRSAGPVAKRRVPVPDPAALAVAVKDRARALGAGVVGIAELDPDQDLYDDVDLPYRYGIVIGVPMRREEMEHVPHARAGREVQRVYGEVARVAIDLAAHIRSLGWPAKAYADPRSTDLLQIPLAIRAGIGQLGKHGSMIAQEYGSNFRLSSVVTDLPLAVDAPVDIGVEDLCATCRRCTLDCPPAAILDEKQWVRGVHRWYVDFDRCAPYFSITYGCGICIEVCPWSEPGRGPKLSATLLAKRNASRRAHEAETAHA